MVFVRPQFRWLPLIVLLSVIYPVPVAAELPQPWLIDKQPGWPDWLRFSIRHRTRYEGQSNAFYHGRRGGDQVIAFRTQVFAEAALDGFRLGAEFIDSRVTAETANTPMSNTLVNEVALLQAYLGWETSSLLDSGLQGRFRFGRQTMDIGSRRLVARNRYRNTINNFHGLDFIVQDPDHWLWRNFVVLPVTRLPTSSREIREGVIRFDHESFSTIFAGSFLSLRNLPLASIGELYFFQLNEGDTAVSQTKNRVLSSPGVRWFRKPRAGTFDFELESTLQTGTSRANNELTETRTLDHFSWFGHAAVGFTFDVPWQPRLVFQYDYASGDKDPLDHENNRYETLYGARRFEFGPTGIWGAFARANINTPGIRLQLRPTRNVSGFIVHRSYWLAQPKDTWVGSGLRDPSGRSGRFIGQQLEARVRWKAIPGQVSLEAGWAHLFKGTFAKNAPGAPMDHSDADYFYVQSSFVF